MHVAAEALVARLRGPIAVELRAAVDLAQRIEVLIGAGRAAHPDLSVVEEQWVDHLARHLREGETTEQLADMHAGDVHLALACLRGSAGAHVRLDGRLRGVSRQALAGIRLGEVAADDVLQAVLERLLVARDGPGKIASYSGRGPLDGWLRVALARAGLSMVRSHQTRAAYEEESDTLLDVATSDDPQLAALQARYAPVLRRAIEAAAAALPAEDRILLRLSVVDGLSIDDLSGIYRAHRATIARRLARVKHAIGRDARARAMDLLGLGEIEFESLMGLMISRFDVTLRRVLGEANLQEEG